MRKKRKAAGSYEVGYGKPPQHTRFKPGQSGHRAGRRRGVLSFTRDLSRILNRRVTIMENGQQRRITKGEAILTQVINAAVSGDVRTMARYLKHVLDLEAHLVAHADAERKRNRTDEELAAEIDRILSQRP